VAEWQRAIAAPSASFCEIWQSHKLTACLVHL